MLTLQGKQLHFAVIGGGHGGLGMAAYLGLKGNRVSLYNRTLENVKKISEQGYIDLTGCISGRGHLVQVTDNMELAIRDADIIMVVVPASAHRSIAESLAPHVRANQYIVLNPGRTGGALEFKNILRRNHCGQEVAIIEAQTFLFACRVTEHGNVHIFSKKNHVKVAALPASQTDVFLALIGNMLPEFVKAENVLETSFNNVGALFHPIPTILNCGRIEDAKGDFLYYIEGITPTIARIIEEVDLERMQIAEALGVPVVSIGEWLHYTYGADGDTLGSALKKVDGYWGIKAPQSMDTRYIFEDVPQSLVPIAHMGRYLGFHTPTIDSIIHLASVMHHTDYLSLGRNVEDMGLGGMTAAEILHYAMTGEIYVASEVVA